MRELNEVLTVAFTLLLARLSPLSLKTYPNSIGITHYLVNRLRGFDEDDVEFYWPQLWCVECIRSRVFQPSSRVCRLAPSATS